MLSRAGNKTCRYSKRNVREGISCMTVREAEIVGVKSRVEKDEKRSRSSCRWATRQLCLLRILLRHAACCRLPEPLYAGKAQSNFEDPFCYPGGGWGVRRQ